MSLRRMALREFVIIEALEIDFASGFTALTGETGAGKSILIDALQMVLGERANVGLVREGANRCDISAEFNTSPAVNAWLDAAGFDHSDSLLLRRQIDIEGKSKAWINGSPCTATQLRELAETLVDIHGQHAWQSLTRAPSVRTLLDAYAGQDSKLLSGLWTTWRQALETLEHAQNAQAQMQNERERLAWQIAEVDKLSPEADEWASLNSQHQRLSHAQTLLDAAHSVIDALESEKTGAYALLSRAQHSLATQSHIEPKFVEWSESLQSAVAHVEDCTRELHQYLGRTEVDEHSLTQLDERLSLWMSLARRFKRAPEELADLWQDWQNQLQTLEQQSDLATLEQRVAEAESAFMREAKSLSAARTAAAPQLSQTISDTMQGLGMQGGSFVVSLIAEEKPAAYGLESVEFLVAGHAGSTPRPIAKVASGGELSRIALAIAVTTSQLGEAGTLIFDEVDAGVGGAVAQTVGKLMQQLGRDRQVLAVTHLPQVAACANHHLRVSKQAKGSQTISTIEELDSANRVHEIARMLGGETLSSTSLAHAKEMLGA